ncbi:SRPBCC family protein [Rhodococcus sp. T7]|uniref:SRPBCC family protein n=1 Tax=Rhodococcus sp. T7 TaxID=627444 RepID=UPI001356B3EC|nr:SRPBCC family protein [Rhodococcus sp. T7]KAF0963714.1 hypothetical protein MLGJGCBP_03152 [Rhodococcus sp. T7]
MIRTVHAEMVFPFDPDQTWDFFFADQGQHLVNLSKQVAAVRDYHIRADGTPRYSMDLRIGPLTVSGTSDYTVFDRPRRTVNAVLSEPFGGVYEMRFEPVVLGTRVSTEWTVEATTHLGGLLLPMVAPLLARALRADLVTIARRACKESLCGP